MKNPFQRRLLSLAAAIVLTGLSIAVLTLLSQWRASELRAELNQVDSESFRIADQFADLLRQLNDLLYRYGQSRVPPAPATFAATSRELDRWLAAQKPKVTTAEERAVMQQIEGAYHDYLAVARDLLAKLAVQGDVSASIDDYTKLRESSHHLFDLGKSLSRVHFASRKEVLARAGRAIEELRLLVLVSLGLLFLFAVALGVVVYRDMVVPLRLKLVESESLRERQEKLASLGVLAAGVAHEIRNPLTAIKAALFIQQKSFQPGSPEAADAQIIHREILRLERIVNDFLLFARPGEPRLQPLTADAPLREVHSLLAPQLAKSNLQLLLAETPPLPIHADADQLKQVLINLTRNAAEASRPNGVVHLRARSGHRRLAGKDTRVVILEVEDKGRGIPPDVQKRLFDPFFTTKETGTGLGLSIAARLVQGHGGLLEYQTAPGVGTTFGIVLPAASGHVDRHAG